jgi:hypothetical protein
MNKEKQPFSQDTGFLLYTSPVFDAITSSNNRDYWYDPRGQSIIFGVQPTQVHVTVKVQKLPVTAMAGPGMMLSDQIDEVAKRVTSK